MALLAAPPELREVGGVRLLAFDPARLGVYAAPLGPGRAAPAAPDEALARSGALAVLNGPMFDVCPGQELPAGNDAYAASRCDALDYLHYDRARGVAAPGAHPHQGLTVSVAGGRAVALAGATAAPGAVVAVQLYPPLVWQGRNVASAGLNTDAVWRSGLAVLGDGRLAFAVGRMPMHPFAEALRAAGAAYAGYTDGGGSTALVVRGVGGWGPREHGVGRRVPSWLTVEPEGPSGLVLALGVGALVAAGVYLLNR